MTVPDKPRLLLTAGFALVFAVALWYRLSSLGAFPYHNADESYYGLQTARMLQGEPFATRTMNHNILNPYLVGLQSLFHLLGGPSVWVLRAPAALFGLLAVILTYAIGRRVLDRTTALIASALLAALPCAVYESRVGLELSQLPLFGLVIIAFALRGYGPGLLVSFLASMLVHPTAIFLFPIALPIFLVQLWRKVESDVEIDPARRRRLLILSWAVSLLVVTAVSVMIFSHPMAQVYLARRPPLNWRNFLDGYERLLFFLYNPISGTTLSLHRWIFRSVSVALLVLGTGRMVCERRWERLALIAGLFASLVVFHLVAGPRMLRVYDTYRYGVVFLLPTALAFACLLRGLLPGPTADEPTARPAFHCIPLAFGLILASASLLSLKMNVLDPPMKSEHESLWTLKPDGQDEYEEALTLIRREEARTNVRAATSIPIVTHDYWAFMPLAYLASSSKNLDVGLLISYDELGKRPLDEISREKQRELVHKFRAGAYVIKRVGVPDAWGGKVIEDTVQASFAPGLVQRWDVPNRGGGPALIVYRLKDAPTPIARREVPRRSRDSPYGSTKE